MRENVNMTAQSERKSKNENTKLHIMLQGLFKVRENVTLRVQSEVI